MDVAQYYVTTLTNAARNLGPIMIALVVGYVVFIKLPLMTVKSNKENKPEEKDPQKPATPEIKAQDEKLKLGASNSNMDERLRMAREEKERNQKRREEERKSEQKKEAPPKRSAAKSDEAMELFDFKTGDVISKKELKKRYHQLLRQNHPDKVASLGADFKKLAEKKTKDINAAYEELKKKAS